MIDSHEDEYSTKIDEIDPAYANFSIQEDLNKKIYIVMVLDENFNEYPGQCIVSFSGEILFSDFSKDINDTILGELNVSNN